MGVISINANGKQEFPPVLLVGDASKYVSIPSSVILNKDLDTTRVAAFAYLMFRRGLDDCLYLSINAMIRWFQKKPNRNKNRINDKVWRTLNAFKEAGYVSYADNAFQSNEAIAWGQFEEIVFNTSKVSLENSHYRFATIYLDEVKTIMHYTGNPKDVYLNSFSLLLVLAYLRMLIARRNNVYRLDEDIYEKQLQCPEAYNGYYKDMADDLGMSVRTFSKVIDCLQNELGLIRYEGIGRTKFITEKGEVKWKTNHTIFCNSYKREKGYLLTSSNSYFETEIANKKTKLKII